MDVQGYTPATRNQSEGAAAAITTASADETTTAVVKATWNTSAALGITAGTTNVDRYTKGDQSETAPAAAITSIGIPCILHEPIFRLT